MTEMVHGEGQNSNFAPAPVNTPSSTPSAPAESERTFRQSEVNDLVGRAKSEAIERYKRETSMQSHSTHQVYTPPQQQQPYQPPQQGYQPPYQPQPPSMSQDEIRRLAAEEANRAREKWTEDSQRNAQEQQAQQIASEFFTKIEAGKANLQDFDKVMGDVDLRTIPYHVQLANMVDNTAEVMYELAKNPSKIGAIQNLIDIDLRAGRQPKLALAEMKRLSESIKTNQQGSKFQSPNEPLSQLRPSNAGTGNQGALSVRDYKAKYRV
jgi:hypothetical protein